MAGMPLSDSRLPGCSHMLYRMLVVVGVRRKGQQGHKHAAGAKMVPALLSLHSITAHQGPSQTCPTYRMHRL